MYFVVIMAFALVLSENLPPQQCNLLAGYSVSGGAGLQATLAIALGQLPLVAVIAIWGARGTLARLDGTAEGHDRAADRFAVVHQVLLFILAGLLILTLICTPWAPLVRLNWGLGDIPLLGDLALLAPFFVSLLLTWMIFYPVEKRFREESFALAAQEHDDAQAAAPAAAAIEPRENHAMSALRAAKKRPRPFDLSLGAYLVDKLRHQVLLLAVPMCIIVLAKHFIDRYGPALVPLPRDEIVRGLILNSALGTVSVVVLVFAPWMLRYIWSTEPLPAGHLRDRFVATCDQIGLRYREILLWHTHGMAVNAAVMGFIRPLRYILVSDALLETMDEDEIEAVFGHEAGHVRHWHLPFFGLFAVVSMFAAGGAMHLLLFLDQRVEGFPKVDAGMFQLVALVVLMLMWLFGFAWLSRKFERQADLFGVRCITPDVRQCSDRCPVHGGWRSGGLCITAANLFGRTLARIADLNGIPKEAPSWRHGSIGSRCRLIEDFAMDAAALKRFERTIVLIKSGLVAVTLVGSAVAVWLYHEPVLRAVRSWDG